MPDKISPFISYAEPSAGAMAPEEGTITVLWLDDMIYFAVREKSTGRYVLLEVYRVETWKIVSGLSPLPENILKRCAGASSRTLVVQTPFSCFAPGSVKEKEKMRKILDFTHILPVNPVIMQNRLASQGLATLFALEKKATDLLNRYFDFPEILHTSTVLIETIYRQFKNNLTDDHLFAHITGSYIEIVRFMDGKLQFYNQFEFKSIDDFIYFILFVTEQLQLNPETMTLLLGGNFELDSEFHNIAEKYIRNVKYIHRGPSVSLGPVLGQLPENQYLLLYNGELCVS